MHRTDLAKSGRSAAGPISAWIFYFCTILRGDRDAGSRRISDLDGAAANKGCRRLRAPASNRDAHLPRRAVGAPPWCWRRGSRAAASISERTAAAAFTSPGKYNMYTCQDIESSILTLRAPAGGAGAVDGHGHRKAPAANSSTRSPTAANMPRGAAISIELAKAKADKQCATDSKFSSGRAVF